MFDNLKVYFAQLKPCVTEKKIDPKRYVHDTRC